MASFERCVCVCILAAAAYLHVQNSGLARLLLDQQNRLDTMSANLAKYDEVEARAWNCQQTLPPGGVLGACFVPSLMPMGELWTN